MIKILKYRKMNKKGIFFTILAIALLSLFAVSYSIYSFVQNREGIDKRIKTLNNFVSSLEEDIPRKLYISGYRIIFLFERKIIDDVDYIEDLNGKFTEAFENGTIDGIDYHEGAGEFGTLLQGATFGDIVDKINEKAKSLNVEVEFEEPSITITQDDPWNVKVTLNSELIIKDKGGLVRWERTTPLYTYIPIDNFEDPIYTLNTLNSVNKFEKTKYSLPISEDDLLLHAENSYYVSSPNAPSFLQRLQGDLINPDPNGIESLVNVHELSSQGTTPKDKCIIDYIYFSNNYPEITGEYYNWIKLCGDYSGRYIS